MICVRCQGCLVVEPLPLALAPEAEQQYNTRFGWLRCLNCGDQLDLYMFRRREREKEHHDSAACLVAESS